MNGPEGKKQAAGKVQDGEGAIRLSNGLLLLLLLAFGLAIAMFAQFASAVAGYADSDNDVRADAIVVLTGDRARISKAFELLRAGNGERLLITGVNQRTSRAAIRSLIPGSGMQFDCCIDIDREAMDTIGNARQARIWAERYGYRSLLLVTSDYHLPRSLIEFEREMANVELIPVPANASASEGSLFAKSESVKRIAPEFVKFVASKLRLGNRSPVTLATLASAPGAK